MNSKHNLLINTVAGTILSVSYLPAVQAGIAVNDIFKFALLAAVGATLSLTYRCCSGTFLKRAAKNSAGKSLSAGGQNLKLCVKIKPAGAFDTKTVTFFNAIKF